MTTLGDTLYIPVDGLVQVFMYEIDPTSLLNGPGRYARLHTGTGDVHFRINESAPINPRAGTVLTLLSKFSMTLSGDVVFTEIPGDGVYRLLQQLDKEGTHDEQVRTDLQADPP